VISWFQAFAFKWVNSWGCYALEGVNAYSVSVNGGYCLGGGCWPSVESS
jgi:hypothetical protein